MMRGINANVLTQEQVRTSWQKHVGDVVFKKETGLN